MRFLKYKILTALLLIGNLVVAQQDPQFNYIFFNPMSVNPAYAGSQDLFCINAINKTQWAGFGDGAPNSTVFNVNMPVAPFGFKSGIGLNIVDDAYGFNNDIGVNFAYAARFNLKIDGTLAIGINGGVMNNTLKPTWVSSQSGDVAIPQGEQSAISFDLGFGLYYNSENMFFGISSTHLNEAKMYKNTETITYTRQYYIMGGYYINFANDAWRFEPSTVINTDLTTSRFSLTTLFLYNKKIWGGVSYRLGEAVIGMVGVELFNGLKIGYAYEFSTSRISSYTNGSHEFMLGYNFSLKREKPPKQYKSIRFL